MLLIISRCEDGMDQVIVASAEFMESKVIFLSHDTCKIGYMQNLYVNVGVFKL